MENIFLKTEFDDDGQKQLCQIKGDFSDMMMDISVHKLNSGETKSFKYDSFEAAFLLLQGDVDFTYSGRTENAKRESVFTEGPSCLHSCFDSEIVVKANSDSEILIQKTENKKRFFTVLHKPISVSETRFGSLGADGLPSGIYRAIFDNTTAPHSSMVMGEVIVPQGGWADYPPHHHPQPEAHYYKFDKPQGFGVGLVGDSVYKITDGSFCAIKGDLTHPQAAAPWYNMYYTWMIRNFTGAPWRDCIVDDDHKWILG